MKLTQAEKEAFKNKILLSVDSHKNDLVQYSIDNLGLSHNTVTKYINELINDDKELLRLNKGRYTTYLLPAEKKDFKYLRSAVESEESVWIKDVLPFIGTVSKQLASILDYSFLEMMNNALEHSEAEHIEVKLAKTFTKIRIYIIDDGIGIFKKIQTSLNLDLPSQALVELAKGKFTSSPENHSGEGIFFSSKMCDEFYIFSDGLCFSGLNSRGYNIDMPDFTRGTAVLLVVDRNTTKSAEQIYAEYAGIDYDEPKFKTVIPLKIMLQEGTGSVLTSRSQARRLVTRFDKFDEVDLDFSEVDFVGQAFADEVFRVYASKHPEITINTINANNAVLNTLKHVLNG